MSCYNNNFLPFRDSLVEKSEKHFYSHAFPSTGIPSEADFQILLEFIRLGFALGTFT